MASKPKSLNDLFLDQLKDIYHAEKQIVRALSKMSKAAQSPDLVKAFETHRTETEAQVERLEQVFTLAGATPRGKTCEAMAGLVEEAKEVMEEYADSDALDAGLIGAAQAVEHYEIARYGTLRSLALQLGMDDAAKLLDQTLAEEKKTDALLTQVAEKAAKAKPRKAA